MGVGIGALSMLLAVYPLDEGEYHCEEAVKHLQDCCPGHDYRNLSCYAGRGCDKALPAIDGQQALSLRDASCRDVVANGWCDSPPITPRSDLSSEPSDLSVPHDLAHPDLTSHVPDLAPADDAGPKSAIDLAGVD
jgi:hypothetical protein